MELNVTRFFFEAGMIDYSASAAEIGQDAGRVTWQAAVDDASEWNLLDTEAKREAFRADVKETGGWDHSEIAAWSDTELNALCMQFVAGNVREAFPNGTDALTEDDWKDYEMRASAGQISGRISRGNDGEIYYYLGN